jgi:hypothetical protein
LRIGSEVKLIKYYSLYADFDKEDIDEEHSTLFEVKGGAIPIAKSNAPEWAE